MIACMSPTASSSLLFHSSLSPLSCSHSQSLSLSFALIFLHVGFILHPRWVSIHACGIIIRELSISWADTRTPGSAFLAFHSTYSMVIDKHTIASQINHLVHLHVRVYNIFLYGERGWRKEKERDLEREEESSVKHVLCLNVAASVYK